EIDQTFVESLFEEYAVRAALRLGRELIHTPDRPGMHGRVDIAERELVSRELPVGMHVPLATEKEQLVLRKLGIEARHRDALEREIPRCKPGIFPAVGHRDHVARPDMIPSS